MTLIWQEVEPDNSPPPIMMREVSNLRTEKHATQAISDIFAGIGCVSVAAGGAVTGYFASIDPWAVATIVVSACAGIGLHWGLLKSYSREAS